MTAALLALVVMMPAEGDLVRDIAVEGLVAVGREVALEGLETRVGERLESDALTRDIKTLWDKRLFADVRVEKQRLTDGWRVVFHVRERPLVRRVVFGGNDGFDDEELLAKMRSAPFREPIDEAAANADAQRLIDHYRAHGYSRAEVVARVEPVVGEPGQADLLFDVREGSRAYVVELAIDGNIEVSEDAILDVLETCEATLMNRLLRGCWYQPAALQTDLLRIQALYYDLGYVSVQVEVPEVVHSDDGSEVSVRVPVTEGKVYRFGRILFSVEKGVPPVFPMEKLQRLVGFMGGEVFDRTRLFDGINRVQSAYRWEVQTIVAITPESELDEEAGLVHLTFTIEAPEPRPSKPGQLLPEPWKPL